MYNTKRIENTAQDGIMHLSYFRKEITQIRYL